MTNRSPSESETTALSQQPDSKAAKPAAEPVAVPTPYKVTDVFEGQAFVELPDGRHIAATIGEGVEGVKRGTIVELKYDTEDKHGAPKDAQVTKVQPK